jgi:hypothetical protein
LPYQISSGFITRSEERPARHLSSRLPRRSKRATNLLIPGNDDAIRAIKLFVESAADAVDTGKLSVANAVADSTDEFVELDAGDAVKPVKKKARAATKKTTDKITVKETAAPKQPEAAAAPEATAAEPEAAGPPKEGAPDKAQTGKENFCTPLGAPRNPARQVAVLMSVPGLRKLHPGYRNWFSDGH